MKIDLSTKSTEYLKNLKRDFERLIIHEPNEQIDDRLNEIDKELEKREIAQDIEVMQNNP